MFRPAIYRETGFDDVFDSLFGVKRACSERRFPMIMNTDVREKENDYEVNIDLPGFSKEDLSVELDKGTLTVTASRNSEVKEGEEKDNYILRERFSGKLCRSFSVNQSLTEEDIQAKYENGILSLTIPKKSAKELEPRKTIAIA